MAVISGTAGPDYINGTTDDDQIEAQDGNDRVFALEGDDTVSGGTDDDELYGDAGNDKIDGGAGIDALDGGAGDDLLIGGAGIDFIGGGEDTDTAYGGTGQDTIGGGAGRDRLFGDAGDDTLHGEAGRDSLYGGSGDDTLLGGADNDNLYAGLGQDLLSGGLGADNLYGSDGSDILSGGVGDNLYGEAGDDVLIWDTEQVVLGPSQDGPNTMISGGAGYDTLRVNVDLLFYTSYAGDLGPFASDIYLNHNPFGASGDLETFIKLGDDDPGDVPGLSVDLESIERIEVSGLGRLVYFNGAVPDSPYSGPSNITVVGTVQDDRLIGGYGDEVLIGGAGVDRLEGGLGKDSLSGEGDTDVFVYAFNPNLPLNDGQNASGLDGNDIILDFNFGERDVIQLDASSDMTSVQATGVSNDANDILITQTDENALLTFKGNGASLQFDTLGINEVGAISGNTLQALENKIISVSGDSSYDPFQII